MFESNAKKSLRFEDIEQKLRLVFLNRQWYTWINWQSFNKIDHLKTLGKMSDFAFKIKNQRVSQSNITDYFQSG